MQGNISEIDLCSILRFIEFEQYSGELFVQTPIGRSWFLFFQDGNIIYATTPETSRLKQYLRGLNLSQALEQINPAQLSANLPEYSQIWCLLAKNLLAPNQAKTLIQSMIFEVLVDLVSLYAGNFVFDRAIALNPPIISIKFSTIASEVISQAQIWQQLPAPDQIPIAHSPETIDAIDGKTSIRQIARYTNTPPLLIAQKINQGLRSRTIDILPSLGESNQTLAPNKPRITCIDDSITICRAVEYILLSSNYQITSISNPIRALSLVFQLKPSLILCDINMPDLDGYELCAMLRKSIAFSQIPIIMLTGKDGFTDRIKARMVGATDYLTKPFKEKELITIVERYLTNSHKCS